jgi:hypothetical protein
LFLGLLLCGRFFGTFPVPGDTGCLEDRVTGAGRHLLGAVKVNPNQARYCGFAVVTDRPLLANEGKAVDLQQTD